MVNRKLKWYKGEIFLKKVISGGESLAPTSVDRPGEPEWLPHSSKLTIFAKLIYYAGKCNADKWKFSH